MTHHTSSNLRSVRTFIASLLTYVLLTSQLAPMAMAFNGSATNGSANLRTSSKTNAIEHKKASEAPPREQRAGSFEIGRAHV